MATLFELKEKLYSLDAEIEASNQWLAEKAADPNTPMGEIKAKQDKLAEYEQRRELLQKQHNAMEEKQRFSVAKTPAGSGTTENDVISKGKASFYRAIAFGDKEATKKAYSMLGAIPANDSNLGNGSNLLPSNLSNELIAEPFEENSLRGVEQTSQVAGLEEPRISFEIDDDDLMEDVIDGQTAKEIKTATDQVVYGRYKTKCKVKVADTVVYGTDTNLVQTIENELRSAMARKEKLRAFAQSADDDHKHMSFYMVGIKGVVGANIVAACMAALGDLPDLFRANAKIVMRSADWYTYIQSLANGSEPLFGKKPEDILGVPVIFNDKAVIPIVGDFRYAKQNYDPVAVLDSDKDVDNGVFKYVLTAWGDHQIRLKSAFRLAIVGVALIGGVAKSETSGHLAGENITATGVFNTDDAHTPASGITYQWQTLSAGTWSDCNHTGNATATVTTVSGTDEDVPFRCAITYSGNTVYTNTVIMA